MNINVLVLTNWFLDVVNFSVEISMYNRNCRCFSWWNRVHQNSHSNKKKEIDNSKEWCALFLAFNHKRDLESKEILNGSSTSKIIMMVIIVIILHVQPLKIAKYLFILFFYTFIFKRLTGLESKAFCFCICLLEQEPASIPEYCLIRCFQHFSSNENVQNMLSLFLVNIPQPLHILACLMPPNCHSPYLKWKSC